MSRHTPDQPAASESPHSRTRLEPPARRAQILQHARRLFGQHGFDDVTVADIAASAGVTRALVHYHFGAKREIYLALIAENAAVGRTLPASEDPAIPLRRRIAANLDTFLDFLEADRETWLATAALGDNIQDPEIRELIERARRGYEDRMIRTYGDVIVDAPETRFVLRSFFGLNQAACRQWLTGHATREQTARLLADTLHTALTRTIPALLAAKRR